MSSARLPIADYWLCRCGRAIRRHEPDLTKRVAVLGADWQPASVRQGLHQALHGFAPCCDRVVIVDSGNGVDWQTSCPDDGPGRPAESKPGFGSSYQWPHLRFGDLEYALDHRILTEWWEWMDGVPEPCWHACPDGSAHADAGLHPYYRGPGLCAPQPLVYLVKLARDLEAAGKEVRPGQDEHFGLTVIAPWHVRADALWVGQRWGLAANEELIRMRAPSTMANEIVDGCDKAARDDLIEAVTALWLSTTNDDAKLFEPAALALVDPAVAKAFVGDSWWYRKDHRCREVEGDPGPGPAI